MEKQGTNWQNGELQKPGGGRAKKKEGKFNEIPQRLMSLCQTDFPSNTDHYIGPTPNLSTQFCLPI